MDAESFWRSMIDGHEERQPPSGETGGRGTPSGSPARLLDAALVVVRAARDLAVVVEELLTEQRERLERAGPQPRGRETGREGQHIDLTY